MSSIAAGPSQAQPGSQTLDLATRIVAAGAASSVAVLIVTPLDVAKVQMQKAALAATHPRSSNTLRHSPAVGPCHDARPSLCMQHFEGSSLSATAGHVRHGAGASMARAAAASSSSMCPTCSPHSLSSLAVAWHPGQQSPGVLSTLAGIVHKERASALWRGLDTALLLNIPVVSIHIPLYDVLNAQLSSSLGIYSPAVAGMAARAVAVVATAPLELVRTRKQASLAPAQPQAAHSPVRRTPVASTHPAANRPHLSLISRTALSLSDKWVGTAATLWRDIPFSGAYWMLTEALRGPLLQYLRAGETPAPGDIPTLPRRSAAAWAALDEAGDMALSAPTVGQVLFANFSAGALSGGLAAALTTPFDVVKTRLQTAGGHGRVGVPSLPVHLHQGATKRGPHGFGTLSMLASIWRSQGLGGLFTGVGPRSLRAMVACGTVIAGYEAIKQQVL